MKLKKLVALTTVLTLCIGFSTYTYANEVDYLLENESSITIIEEIVSRGSSAPSSSASKHDLSISSYNYQVKEVGAQVYTDKWLTGVTKMKVDVSNWKVLEDYGGTNNELTIVLYNSSKKQIATKTINPNITNSVTFSGLNSSTNYYVKFAVSTNGNKYSFNGTIS